MQTTSCLPSGRAPAASLFPRFLARLPRGAALLAPAALLLAALAFAAPAQAQTSVTAISNNGQSFDNSSQAGNFRHDYATSFTTGSSAAGYKFTSVDLYMWEEVASAAAFVVRINQDNGSGAPGTVLATLSTTDSIPVSSTRGSQPLTFSGEADLDADTTYWVVLDAGNFSGANVTHVSGTGSDAEDSGGLPGWSIGDNRRTRAHYETSWGTDTNTNALRIKLTGYANPVPLRRSWAGPVSGRMGPDGRTLTLYFGEALDGSSVPAAARFPVNVAGTNRTPTGVAVAGSTVTLTLGTAAGASAAVTVSYDAAAATSPLRTRAGAEVDRLSGLPVANDRGETAPSVSAVSITSTPSLDADSDNVPETYGAGETVRVRLTFSTKVTVDPPSARPRLKLKLHASAGNSERWAVYESGSGTEQLVFAYEVASGDSSSDGTTDGGIAVVANSLELNGGLIRLTTAGLAASLAHAELGHDSDHKVDGSSEGVAPAFESATVDGTALTVTFDEDLDSGSLPAGSSFRVGATPPGGSARSVSGSSAATTLVSGSSSELEVVLSEPVRPGEAVTVGYTQPASNPLRDASANAVASFSGKPATNATAMPAVPTGVEAEAEDADGNSLKGGSLRVTWTPPAGSITGYELRYYKGTADPPAGRESDWIENRPGLPPVAGLPAPDGTANEASIEGLTAGTAYRVQVRAANGPGRSPWSASASATTAAAASTNTPPRVLRNNGNTSGNVCEAVDNTYPIKREIFHPAQADVIASFTDLVGVRNTATDAWPRSCNTGSQADRWSPLFDDVNNDKLVIHAEPDPVPDNVRVHPGTNFVIAQPDPDIGTNGSVFFLGLAAFREPGQRRVRAKLTATDPHGASVSVRVYFNISPLDNNNGAPQVDPVPDQNVSVGRAVSLVLPAATGGDMGLEVLKFPYAYAVSGLPEGLTFDPETRTVSGMPGETGAFTVTYTADDIDKVGSAYLDPDCPNGTTVDGTACGNDTATQTFTINVRPFIELIRVVSAATHDANGDGVNDTYVRGDVIVVDLEFTEPVELGGAVKTSDTSVLPYDYYQTVRSRISVGPRGNDGTAGSRRLAYLVDIFHGGKTLRLAYRVRADDHDPDGVAFEKTRGNDILLLVGGATLKGKVSGLDADRTRTDHVTLHYAVNENGQPLTYVSGRATVSGPLPVSATVDGATLSVTFDDGLAALDADDVAALPMYIGVQGAGGTGGNRNAFQHPTGFALTGDNDETLTMTLGVPAQPGDRVTLSYKRIDHKGPLADDEGNMAPAFVDFAVQNDTIGEPEIVASGVTLVGNGGRSGDGNSGNFTRGYATSFTTGSASGGYVLTGVDVFLRDTSANSSALYNVVVLETVADTGLPYTHASGAGAEFVRTVSPGNTFTRVPFTHAGMELEANTTYWVALLTGGFELADFDIDGTSSDAEDSGGQSGWSIGDNRLWRLGINWNASNTNDNALRIKLTGDVKDVPTGPRPLEASVAGTALKIVFDAALDETSSVSGQHFTVRSSDLNDDETTIAGTAADATVSGSTVTVTLAEAVPPGVLASVTYDPPALDIRAAGGGDRAPRFARFKIETVFDTMAPALTQVGVVQTSENPAGFRAALYFDEALDPDSVPAAGDFSITLDSRDAVTATAAKIEGSAVVLTLDLAAAPEDEEVDGTYAVAAVSYTKGTNPIQDLAGNQAAGFTEEDVRVEQPGTPVPGPPPGKLVGNTGQARHAASALTADYAQGFATGSNAGGYRLTHVELAFEVDNPSGSTGASYSVEIWSRRDGLPDTRLGTLTKTGSSALVAGLNTFTAPGTGIGLDASTSYFVVVDASSQGDRQEKFVATASDVVDAGAAAGWAIAATSSTRNDSTWVASSWERKIAVYGNAIAAGTGLPLPPPATNTTLVGNDGQTSTGAHAGSFERWYATSFTTGSASLGYVLKGVDLWASHVPSVAFHGRTQVDVHTDASGVPGTWLGKGITNSVTTASWERVQHDVRPNAVNTGPVGIDLDPDTKYWVVARGSSSSAADLSDYYIGGTSSDAEDSGGQSGWSIGDHRLWTSISGSWSTSNTNTNALRLRLIGIVKEAQNPPVSVAGSFLTIAFDRSLDPASVPPPEAFTLRHLPFAGQTDTPEEYATVTAVAVEGSTVVLQLGSPVYPCAGVDAEGVAQPPFTVTYERSETGNNLRTMTGHLADEMDAVEVTNTRAELCGKVGVTASSGGGAGGSGGPSGQGKSVRLKFDRPLDRDKALKASAFGLAVTSGGAPAVRDAAYSADGSGVVLTLGRAIEDGETVTVSYTRGARDPGLWDNGGNQIADFSGVEVTRVTPAAVAVVSDAGEDDTYALGETIRVKVTFAEAVTVDTAGGTPRLAIDMDPADWGRKWAAYESGSGTAELVFAYRVAEPNESTGGIAVLADTLEANGGSIALSAGGAGALSHAGLGHDPAHKVDWRLAPAGAASVTGVALVSDAGGDDTYALGEAVRVRVTFSEAVTVDTAGGTPRLRIDMDPAHWGAKWAAYESGSGTAELVFAYEVVKPNESTSGVAVLADTLEANGGALRAAAAGTDAHLAHAGLGHDPAHKVDWRLAPAPSGAVSATGVAVVSTPAVGDTYQVGETIQVRVTFDDAVTVDTSGGTPRLQIDMDPAHWGAKWAAYESGSGTQTLTFAYEVVWPNESTKGIAVVANTLGPNGGTIRAADGGATAHLSHAGLGHDPAHKVDWRLGAAAVTGVQVSSRPAGGDTYFLGETIQVAVTFAEAVTVDVSGGKPRLQLDLDPAHWGAKWVVYEGGSGTETLTFAYTVVEPNESVKGIAVLANTLQRNGGGIRTAAEGVGVDLAHDGLDHDPAHKVDWRPALSVADAEAHEGEDDAVEFVVTLSHPASRAVSVDYATADGSATAGQDYTATSGTLTFDAGESSKTIAVPLLDDAIDEGEETFTLTLSNARGARIEDGEATGTIINSDHMPKAWTSRFGRTVAVHVVDAVEARLDGASESYLQVGGQRLGGPAPEEEELARRLAPEPSLWEEADSERGHLAHDQFSIAGQTTTFRDLLLGSAFHLASDPGDEPGAPRLSAWGRIATSGFDGREDELTLNGTVTTATLGVDSIWKRWLTGLLLAYSEGDGSFTHLTAPGGEVSSTLTSLHPYAAYALSDRVRLWGVVGYGSGAFRLLEDARVDAADDGLVPPGGQRSLHTGLTMTMGALGVRGTLLQPAHGSGFELAVRSDVLWMGMDSAAADNLAATSAETSRLRLVLEGSRPVALAGGGSFIPALQVGLRHDGGDAETGTGVEVGGSLRYASAWGLSIEASLRALVAHEAQDYTEWGASGALRFDPGRQGRGLTASVTPTWGAAGSGVERLWGQSTAAGLVPADAMAGAAGRLAAELGYGLATFQGRGLLTPYTRVALTEGADQSWHLGTRLALAETLNLSLEASRRQREGAVAAHELALRANLGF